MPTKPHPTPPAPAEEQPVAPVSAKGDHIALPPRRVVSEAKPVHAKTATPRKTTAAKAGTASTLFPSGGAAFAAWCKRKGIDPERPVPEAEYNDLLTEFAARPIMGHRRTGSGGPNHRANREDLRR